MPGGEDGWRRGVPFAELIICWRNRCSSDNHMEKNKMAAVTVFVMRGGRRHLEDVSINQEGGRRLF